MQILIHTGIYKLIPSSYGSLGNISPVLCQASQMPSFFFYVLSHFLLASGTSSVILICNRQIFQHMLCHFNRFILYSRTVNVSVPKKTRNNGTLYAYIFLHHAGILPWHDGKQVHIVSPLTTYMVPKPEEINLLTGESATQVGGFFHLQMNNCKKRISSIDTSSVSICCACIFTAIMIWEINPNSSS